MNLVVNRLFRVCDDSDDHDRFRYTVHIFPCYGDRDSSTTNNVESTVIINSKWNIFLVSVLKHKKKTSTSQFKNTPNTLKCSYMHVLGEFSY